VLLVGAWLRPEDFAGEIAEGAATRRFWSSAGKNCSRPPTPAFSGAAVRVLFR
jgi:hypothetical protein